MLLHNAFLKSAQFLSFRLQNHQLRLSERQMPHLHLRLNVIPNYLFFKRSINSLFSSNS